MMKHYLRKITDLNVLLLFALACTTHAQVASKHFLVTGNYFGINSDLDVPTSAGVDTKVTNDREGDLWGASITYQVSDKSFLDFHYHWGDSNASFSETYADPASFGALDGTAFNNLVDADDRWYELRYRRNLTPAQGQSFYGFFAGGITFIESDSNTRSNITFPAGTGLASISGLKTATAESDSLFLNGGGGLSWYQVAGNMTYGLRGDANVLLGRAKNVSSTFDTLGALTSTTTTKETIFGALGGLSAWSQFSISSAAKIYLDGGIKAYYWDLDAGDQLIYGPHARLGLNFNY